MFIFFHVRTFFGEQAQLFSGYCLSGLSLVSYWMQKFKKKHSPDPNFHTRLGYFDDAGYSGGGVPDCKLQMLDMATIPTPRFKRKLGAMGGAYPPLIAAIKGIAVDERSRGIIIAGNPDIIALLTATDIRQAFHHRLGRTQGTGPRAITNAMVLATIQLSEENGLSKRSRLLVLARILYAAFREVSADLVDPLEGEALFSRLLEHPAVLRIRENLSKSSLSRVLTILQYGQHPGAPGQPGSRIMIPQDWETVFDRKKIDPLVRNPIEPKVHPRLAPVAVRIFLDKMAGPLPQKCEQHRRVVHPGFAIVRRREGLDTLGMMQAMAETTTTTQGGLGMGRRVIKKGFSGGWTQG